MLGNVASERFGINRLAALVARLAHECGDSAFFSIRRDVFAVCVLREDGDYPLKTHVLLPGDRHPLGVGAGSLAILAALPDDEVDACLQANAALIARRYPHYSVPLIRALVDESRERGYSVNQGLVVPGSWASACAARRAGACAGRAQHCRRGVAHGRGKTVPVGQAVVARGPTPAGAGQSRGGRRARPPVPKPKS